MLEMLISLTLLLVLSGAILGGMGKMQNNYRGNEIRGVLHGQMRATLEMMDKRSAKPGYPSRASKATRSTEARALPGR